MRVHNILVTRAPRNTWTLSVNNCKEITQLTTFPAKIKLSTTNQAQYSQCFHTSYGRNIIKLLSLNNSRFFHINHHTYANIPDKVDLFKIPDVDEPFWTEHIQDWPPGRKSASILLSSNRFYSYKLLFEARDSQIKARNMMPFRFKPKISVSPV